VYSSVNHSHDHSMPHIARGKERGVYKFLHSRHLNDILRKGTLKIGSLSNYRGLEAKAQWIADELEGSIRLDPSGMVITEADNRLDPMLPQSLAGRHVHVESGGQIAFAPGVTMTVQHPEVYIFSASEGDLCELADTMCRGAHDPYDACIQIRDIHHLAHRLFYRGAVPELANARMSKLFQAFECSGVRYDVLARGPELGRAPEASPFLKDAKFAAQHEIRIVFWPRKPVDLSTLLVRIPRPNQLFEEVFRSS